MTDKYEEFKEFVREKYFPNPSRWGGIFNDFEEQCAKKEKEKEIKDTIEQALHEEHCCFDGTRLYANAIYNKLKEKDLIK